MPALKSVKRERFAVYVSQAHQTQWSIARCYTEAGFRAQARSAQSAASRLLRIVAVADRVRELMEPVIQKSRLTLEFLISEIEKTLRDAREDRCHSACIQALALVTKIHEMVRERESVEHQFQGAMDVSEIMTVLLDDVGPREAIEICTEIIEAARARLADRAVVVS
jgi:hypothetical protein